MRPHAPLHYPDWLLSPTLPPEERRGLVVAQRQLVDEGLAAWVEDDAEFASPALDD